MLVMIMMKIMLLMPEMVRITDEVVCEWEVLVLNLS